MDVRVAKIWNTFCDRNLFLPGFDTPISVNNLHGLNELQTDDWYDDVAAPFVDRLRKDVALAIGPSVDCLQPNPLRALKVPKVGDRATVNRRDIWRRTLFLITWLRAQCQHSEGPADLSKYITKLFARVDKHTKDQISREWNKNSMSELPYEHVDMRIRWEMIR
ncbi:hypothetical protein EJ04DRAFT_561987 [Polyplosphaeria fusca]|uniref:Uncharacterized protein n=1 Tax=Polyplosphaeria fusca TaxID=682080 RepID=A0A9P4R5M9_9PLEO|nr:hypothetical protein EJ04DRAFT_561987 [Polyplosphaeria fusca]